jgi:Ethanolamine utilization protein EutJ (predicted chaperonin)
MSEKKSKTAKKSTLVDITKLRLGIDITTGRIIAGIANEEGVIDTSQLVKDITEDFYEMVQEIQQLRQLAEKVKPKIVMATEVEKKVLKIK